MESRLLSFDIDPVTEERLRDVAIQTGIQNNAATIRFLINKEWQTLKADQPQPIEVKEELQRR